MTKNKKQIESILAKLLVVLGVTFFTFLLVYLSPGDPAKIMLSECGITPNPETLAKAREDLGLNDPFLIRYFNWLKNAITGNMGESYSMKAPVVSVLKERLWPTVKLSLLSLLIMILISVPAGVIAAVNKNRWIDYVIRFLTFFGVSMPNFWIGLIFLSFFGVKLGWIKVAGGTHDFQGVIMPAITLAIAMSAKYTRQVRLAVLNELKEDYVVGCRLRGMSERKILFKHVLPNAALPLLTLLGLSLGSLLGGTAVVEIVYNYPGLGSMAVKAISSQDFPLIQGYVLWVAVIYIVINSFVDYLQRKVDPRVEGGAK